MLGVAEGEGYYRPEQVITLSIFQGGCTQWMQFDIRHMPTGEFQIEAPELSIGSLRFEAFDKLSNSTFKGEIISTERIEQVERIARLFIELTNQVVWRHWQGLDERQGCFRCWTHRGSNENLRDKSPDIDPVSFGLIVARSVSIHRKQNHLQRWYCLSLICFLKIERSRSNDCIEQTLSSSASSSKDGNATVSRTFIKHVCTHSVYHFLG